MMGGGTRLQLNVSLVWWQLPRRGKIATRTSQNLPVESIVEYKLDGALPLARASQLCHLNSVAVKHSSSLRSCHWIHWTQTIHCTRWWLRSINQSSINLSRNLCNITWHHRKHTARSKLRNLGSQSLSLRVKPNQEPPGLTILSS